MGMHGMWVGVVSEENWDKAKEVSEERMQKGGRIWI